MMPKIYTVKLVSIQSKRDYYWEYGPKELGGEHYSRSYASETEARRNVPHEFPRTLVEVETQLTTTRIEEREHDKTD